MDDPRGLRFSVGGIAVEIEPTEVDLRLRSNIVDLVLGPSDPTVIRSLIERTHPGVVTTLSERARCRVSSRVIDAVALRVVIRRVQERSWQLEGAALAEADLGDPTTDHDTIYSAVVHLGVPDVPAAMTALAGWSSERYEHYLDHLAFMEWK